MTSDTIWDFDSLSADTRSAEESLAQGDATNALVASVLADSVGRGPAVPDPGDPHVALPGGLYWEGELVTAGRVRELTGTDEETLAAVTGSIARWMSALLELAVDRIGDEKPTPAMIRKLLIGDRDALLLGVRIATFGPLITLNGIVCPHCDAAMDATVDLTTVDQVVLDNPQPRHEYEVPLRRGGVATVRLPNGEAQELIFGEDSGNSAQRNTKLLGHCLVGVTDPEGNSVDKRGDALAQSLGMADRQTVLRYLADNQPGPKLDDIRFVHEACGEEVRLPLTLPELFRI